MKARLVVSAIAGLFVMTAAGQQPVLLKLTATSANVSEPGVAVRIDISGWSTDKDRDQLLTALNPPPPPPPPAPGAADESAPRGGDAAGRGGRGGARGAAGRGGARGGGGRGGGRGGAGGAQNPMASLTTAIDRAQTLGYIWTNEVAGYAIKYAVRVPSPDGGERIILGTNRRIGEHALAWQPVGGTPTDYSFTLLEIRLNPKGSGEGKASLTSRIVADNEAKMLRLDDYAAAPALIENVRRQ